MAGRRARHGGLTGRANEAVPPDRRPPGPGRPPLRRRGPARSAPPGPGRDPQGRAPRTSTSSPRAPTPWPSRARAGATGWGCASGGPAGGPSPGSRRGRSSGPTTRAPPSRRRWPRRRPSASCWTPRGASPPERRLRVTGGGGKWALETAGAPPAEAPAGSTLELSPADDRASGPCATPSSPRTGRSPPRAPCAPPWCCAPSEPGDALRRSHYKPASEVAGRPGHYYDAYRGELILTPRGDGLETVNRLTLQDYLKGVAPAEMPSTWPAEALKAQVLAARTYAVTQARGRASERFDVDDTTRFQVYLGANAERPNVNDLIDVHRGGGDRRTAGSPSRPTSSPPAPAGRRTTRASGPAPPSPICAGSRTSTPAGAPTTAGPPGPAGRPEPSPRGSWRPCSTRTPAPPWGA